MRLSNKVAIITGAGQGIGRQYASAFAAEGAKVVIADLNTARAEETAETIRAGGGEAIAITVDVSDEASVNSMVQQTVDQYGTVDILINNAAIFSTIKMKPFDEIELSEWESIFAVNSRGTFLACKAVAPIMKKNEYGKIVNISSSVVVTGRPNYAHYIASKGAVWALTHALATELGEFNVNVNTVSPHGIVTEIPRETISEAGWAQNLKEQAVKRKGESSDVVGAVLFLSSDESQFITGQTLSVDAGLRYT